MGTGGDGTARCLFLFFAMRPAGRSIALFVYLGQHRFFVFVEVELNLGLQSDFGYEIADATEADALV